MIRADMIGIRRISASRLLVAALLAFGCALMVAPAPAAAQDQAQETPWYMPQPWVYPPATSPRVRALPGYYGSAPYSRNPYGSFASGCYGRCGYTPGTVATGNGVVLYRPTVVAYDQNAYELVPRGYYQTRTVYVSTVAPRQAMMAQRPAYAAAKPVQQKPLPQFSIQNGVRIIRPAPLPPAN